MVIITGKRKREPDDDDDGVSISKEGKSDRRAGQEPVEGILRLLHSSEALSHSSAEDDQTSESSSLSSEDDDDEDDYSDNKEEEEEDETSSSGSDSESEEHEVFENSESEDIVDLTGSTAIPPKIEALPQSSDLRSRLSTLLPQLKKANAQLESGPGVQIDDVADDEDQYIEMDLSLGVLKERKTPADGEIKTAVEDDSSSDDLNDESDHEDAVQKALRKDKTSSAGIEEVDAG